MARTKQTPNFDGMKARLAAAESLYNVSLQSQTLYKDAIKGLDSSRAEVEILVQVALEALMAMGISYEEIKAVAQDIWQVAYIEEEVNA